MSLLYTKRIITLTYAVLYTFCNTHTHNYDVNIKNILITYQLVYNKPCIQKIVKNYDYVCITDESAYLINCVFYIL